MALQTHTTEIRTGRIGAKRQTFAKENPRTVLLKLIADNPHDTREDEANILELFWHAVRTNETALRTICEYWGTNNYRSIVYLHNPRNGIARDEEVAKIKASIASKIILSDWVLPNGKKLRDCTKADCLKQGGWLLKVGRKLKKNQTVGQVLSEEQLRQLWQ